MTPQEQAARAELLSPSGTPVDEETLAELRRLIEAEELRNAEFREDQPRDDDGRWVGGGESTLTKIASDKRFIEVNQKNPVFDHLSSTDREVFLKDYKKIPDALRQAKKDGTANREMDITNVVATQKSIEVSQVAELVRDASLADDATDGPPLLVTWHDRVLIADGHHRIAAALLRGEKRMNVEYLNLDGLRSAKRYAKETLVHKAADAHYSKFAVAIRYAFAMGRRAVDKPALRTAETETLALAALDAAPGAVAASLAKVLPNAVLAALTAGGAAGVALLRQRLLRSAAFNEDQPRDEQGQWTSDGGPAKGMTRLYRIEPKTFTDNSWLKKHLTPEQWADAENARGRLFSDNLTKAKDYGHGASTHNSFFVDVPDVVAKETARTHPEGWTEYLLPKEHVDKKKSFRGAELRTAAPQVKGKSHSKIPPFDLAFNVTNPDVIDWAEQHAAELIDDITKTTKKRIKQAVVTAFEGGNLRDAEDDILAAIGDETRAQTIAHHETMLAASEGQRQSWDQAIEEGLIQPDTKRVWIATSDNTVCPICEELDGKTAVLDGEYPNDGGNGPPQHVNCRCSEGLE